MRKSKDNDKRNNAGRINVLESFLSQERGGREQCALHSRECSLRTLIVLALETTEKFGSVAMLAGQTVLDERQLPNDRRSSQTLHPAIQSLFQQTRTKPASVDVVVVVVGPGSFTGLRVGVTAAKVFAYLTGAKIFPMDTFRTVAAAMSSHTGMISVGVDAQRGEVIAAVLQRTASGQITMIREPALMSVDLWRQHADLHDNVLFAGPALERWSGEAKPNLLLADKPDWQPKASVAGKLAVDQIRSGQFVDAFSLQPSYSRLSAAEEKWAKEKWTK